MKNIFLTTAVALVFMSCSEKSIDTTSFQGNYSGVYPGNETEQSMDLSFEFSADSLSINLGSDKTYRTGYTTVQKEDKSYVINAFVVDNIDTIHFDFIYSNDPGLIVLTGFKGMDIDLKTAERLMKDKVGDFATVKLTADISHLTASEKAVLPLLFDAAKIMDELYWIQACPDKADILAKITDENAKKYFDINYGPWDILDNFKPFVDGVGKKPDGVNFYPKDMTKEEFEALEDPAKNSWYTVIIRDENKKLKVVPYHEYYSPKIQEAANLLKEAAKLADNPELKKYLELRAVALETGNYFDSDMAWMDMKSTNIDFVIGPIESYEDALFGNKTSFESFVLIKDPEWSSKLERFSKLLPEMQKSLPVDEKYKKDVPGKDSDMGVYYALYYAGDCNSGSKTIAINLPNDKEINAKKGSRKLQLKNSMQAKFDQILVPISNVLICEEQRKHVKFDAFFENTMFHEIAHGLGVSKTINGKGLVTEALKDQHTALEEGKADIGGLYLITKLHEMGEIKDKELMDNYVTFMAGIFRSIRFGAASAHGKANLVRYYYFEEKQAFTRDEKTGTYKIDFEKMKAAVSDLTNLIIVLQGEGDYDGAKKMMDEKGVMGQTLKSDLARIAKSNIPKDIVFEQGKELLNL